MRMLSFIAVFLLAGCSSPAADKPAERESAPAAVASGTEAQAVTTCKTELQRRTDIFPEPMRQLRWGNVEAEPGEQVWHVKGIVQYADGSVSIYKCEAQHRRDNGADLWDVKALNTAPIEGDGEEDGAAA